MTLMYSIAEFCQLNGISRSTLYKLKRAGLGPKTVQIGRRRLITREAAEEWRSELEQQSDTSELGSVLRR